nr:ABC transporter permease [Denitromonas sp.]
MADALRTPELHLSEGCLSPAGDWTLLALGPHANRLRKELAAAKAIRWDLSALTRLDSFGALLLWRAWGGRLPAGTVLPDGFATQFERFVAMDEAPVPHPPRFVFTDLLAGLGAAVLGLFAHLGDFLALIGRLALDSLHLLGRPRNWPLKEFSANLYKVGVKAM